MLITTAALASLAPRAARAQIVDVQRLLAADPEEGLSGGVDGSLDVRRGDAELTAVSGSANAGWRRGDLAAYVLVQGERTSAGGVRLLEKNLEHLRFRWIGGRIQAETFFQHDRDRFRRRELRALWGTGPRAVVYRSEIASLTSGLAAMAELERLSSGPYADSGRVTVNTRASLYTSARWKLDSNLQAGQTLYLQPRADDLRDMRTLSESELMIALGARLSIRLTAGLAYDSQPPEQVRPMQLAIKTSFHLDLGERK